MEPRIEQARELWRKWGGFVVVGALTLLVLGGCVMAWTAGPAKDPRADLTAAQRSFLEELNWPANDDTAALAVGAAWCEFFRTDRTQVAAMTSGAYQAMVAGGYEANLIDHGYDAASSDLCPGAFRARLDTLPEVYVNPQDEQDSFPDPEPPPDQDYGPRG